ncbi:MAG: beta-lactamase family protein [Microthrixaceae bacterium]|nr:beta-lactamase family protein [Microthrixaceae bacterium]
MTDASPTGSDPATNSGSPADRSWHEIAAQWPADNVAIAVVNSGGIVESFGDLDRRFRLASVTKPLVATAIWLAVEEGALTLDTPAGPPGSTVRHLLCHASGVGPDDDTILAAPGTRRIYSNHGFALLAQALEAHAGMTVEHYLHDGVLEPLAMSATSLDGPPGSGAVGSARDLATWVMSMLNPGTLLDSSTIAEATTVQFADIDGVLPGYGTQRPNPWGLGVEIRGHKSPHWTGSLNSPETYGHFGQTGTFVWIDPVRSLGLVGLGDLDFGNWALPLWPVLSDAVIRTFGGT